MQSSNNSLPTIEFVGGSTQNFAFNVYQYATKLPFDLSSCSADFSITDFVNPGGEPIISKGMTITKIDQSVSSSVSNVLKVTLNPRDTVNLHGKYIYQISIKHLTGEIDIPQHGTMYINSNINKAYANS